MTQFYMDEIIKRAILEDINYIDVSADYLFEPVCRGKAKLLAKDDGVLCGLAVFLRVFELLDSSFSAECFKKDGDPLRKGDIIAVLSGATGILLKGERTALNLIQHLSGIATQTAAAVQIVKGTKAQITDTRKTLPGLFRRSNMRSRVATKSAVIALALAGTAVAFIVGAQAGALLNGRVMAVSVARVPMPVLANPKGSPVNTHVR